MFYSAQYCQRLGQSDTSTLSDPGNQEYIAASQIDPSDCLRWAYQRVLQDSLVNAGAGPCSIVSTLVLISFRTTQAPARG